ncbi:MAG: aminotransferase class V-fold PLP-dependent enzyme [Alteraurantiacibacter sp.]
MIASQRHRFAIPEDVHYLNCAYMAPLADTVSAAMVEGARRKEQPWLLRPVDFFGVVEEFRSRAARLAGVSADSIAVVPSVSYAMAIAARNLPLARGQSVVTLADQFPSNVYPWRKLAADNGGEVVTVHRDAFAAWTDAVLDAIGPDTAIVAMPQCHWADGRVVDLVAVGEACRANGAALVLDLTQSLGAMAIDFAAVQPDFAVAACYKWLLGPYGLSMTYIDPKHHRGDPLEQNWINRAGSEDFARLVDYRDDYQPGARRFDMGEKSNPPLLAGGSAALYLIGEFGVEAIAGTLAARTSAIAKAAAPLGFDAAPVGIRAPHFLSLSAADGLPPDLAERLAEAQVHVSVRGQSLRVTPHLWTSDADVEALLAAIAT